MESRQQQVMDSFVRVRAFLEEHPATGVLTYASARGMLDDVIQRLHGYARAQVEPESDVGLPAALRMPKNPLSPTKLITVCDGMIEAARPHEGVFSANGLPTDFLAHFASARDALERLMGGRAKQVGAHVAARAGLQVQFRRGRRAVERLDAVVRASFRSDLATLMAWRGAKRVQQTPGGAGARDTAEVVQAA